MNDFCKHPLTGHSVGKTLFCRLLRHGLGEHRYGTGDQKARIQNTFPEGWLGLEAELDGEPWAILRKIGKGEISYSAAGIGLADLVPSLGRQEYQGLQAWWDALGRKLSSGIHGFDPVSTSDWMMQQWLKLLSWCARDQETRFRKAWQWRSKDSASDSPRILMNEAQRIIRGTLGLLNTDDAKIEMEYLRLKQRKDALKLEIESLSQEPAFRLRLHDEWLKEQEKLFPEYDQEKLLENDPVGQYAYPQGVLEKLAREKSEGLQDELGRLRGQLHEIDVDLETVGAEIKRVDVWIRKSKTVIKDSQEYIDQENAGREALEKLRAFMKSFCPQGNVKYNKCEFYKKNLAEKEAGVRDLNADKRMEREALLAASQQQADIEAMDERDKFEAIKLNLENFRVHLVEHIDLIEGEAIKYRKLHEDVLDHLLARSAAEQWANGEFTGTPLEAALAEEKDLNEKIATIEEARKKESGNYGNAIEQLTDIFNALVTDILGGSYGGFLSFDADGLQFVINENDGLNGEAVATLSTLLADVASMLASVVGLGCHPRFLVHDSPREGDLDRYVYEQFLNILHDIHHALGGEADAPFQYIITTTTTPPQRDLDLVRLRLCSEPRKNMLFSRILAKDGSTMQVKAPEQAQIDMFVYRDNESDE